VYDKSVKGYVLESEGGRDVKMQVPAGDKEVTWLIHMWDMTHSYVSGMAHAYVGHDSFIREWHGSFIRVT